VSASLFQRCLRAIKTTRNLRLVNLKTPKTMISKLIRSRGSALPMNKKSPHNMDISPSLSAFTESLGKTITNAEPAFLQLGQELQSVNSNVNNLTELIVKTTALIGKDSDYGILVEVEGLVNQSLKEIKGCRSEVSQSLGHCEIMAEDLISLCKTAKIIKKIPLTLSVIGLNIGIESARSLEGSNTFTLFVEEIQQLGKTIKDASTSISTDSKEAREDQLSAHIEISDGLVRLSALIGDVEDNVRIALAEIGQIMGHSQEILKEAAIHSKEISRLVGEIVMALQFHDITRQQTEHIIEALDDSGKLSLNDLKDPHVKIEKEERLGSVHSILQVQAGQLNKIISEIEITYQTIMNGFEKISTEVGLLVSKASGFTALNKDTGSLEDSFSRLKSIVIRFQKLLNQGRELDGSVCNAAGEASEAVSRLSSYIEPFHDIREDLKLKALNAIISAEHIGDGGKVFGILAQEVTSLSETTNDFVGNVIGILESIDHTSQKLKTGSHEMTDSSDIPLESIIEKISSIYVQFQEDMQDLSKKASDIKDSISGIIAELSFFPELVNSLKQYLKELGEIVHMFSPWARDEVEKFMTDVAQHEERYTMESERNQHRKILDDEVSIEVGGIDSEESAAMEEDELGDNVELF